MKINSLCKEQLLLLLYLVRYVGVAVIHTNTFSYMKEVV